MPGKRKSPDFLIFFVTLLLLSVGIVMVFSASAYSSYMTYGDAYYYLKKQLLWALLGVAAMVFTMNIDYRQVKKYVRPIFTVSVVLLITVLAVGVAKNGSTRWLGIGPIGFQPSEIMKLAMVMYMAKRLSERGERLTEFSKGLMPHLGILSGVCLLILAQPDLGTAVAIAGTTYLLFLIAGAKKSHLSFLAVAGVGLVILAIILEPYRMERFVAFWDPWKNPSDTGWQTIQSLLALGSGGFFGVGLGQSKQKLFYLPERHTDFIYAILGEELGFIGAVIVLILFFIFIWRGFRVAVTIRDNYGSLLAAGITLMVTIQALINIAVVTGSMPVTGITLPFISYGGSSLTLSLVGVGMLLNISRYT
ncbi:stage V sporulation protein E [Metallumcola ferriviriculae]|uniref:Probable peptidoglycan glycosyltransferase FtsW n=1 Tax=Metallumcola ferriviriculae TaxID=3039180 RepID=A0AAU0UKW4_9FIRM|nr:stage V sporulation protein E [Desulfitibacteraceae bacterium MK1]